MKIDRIHIEGFGHFRDFDLPLSGRLDLICGENEAGKSTLLGFIRCVLFGFEGRKSATRYEVSAGPFGGELHLSTARGPLIVRRQGGRKVEGDVTLRGAHGAPEPASRLEEALRGVSRDLFCQVFAFGLHELSSFEELAAQSSVTEALFAAGMQGARRLPHVTAELRKSSEELFRPSGRKQRLNELLARLEDVRGELSALGDRPARYFELLDARARLDDDAAKFDEALRRARAEHARLAQLEKIAPALVQLRQLQRELAALPADLVDFPADGATRLDAQLLAVRRCARDLADAQGLSQRVRAQLEEVSAQLAPQERVLALGAARDAFMGRLELHRALASRRAELAARRRHAQEAVRELGLGVPEEALLTLDVGASARTQLATCGASVEEALRTLRERGQQLRDVQQRLSDVRADLQKKRAQAQALCAEEVPGLRRRQAALYRLPTLEVEARRVEEGRADTRRDLEEAKASAEAAPEPSVPGWIVWAAVAFGAAIVLAAYLFNGAATALAALAVACALSGGIAFLYRRGKRAHAQAQQAYAARSERREERIRRLEEKLAQLEGRLTQLSADRISLAKDAGVSADRVPPAGELKALQEEVARKLEEAEQRAVLAADISALEDREARLARDEEAHNGPAQQAEAALQQARAALASFLEERQLPSALDVQAAQTLLAAIADAQKTLRDVSAQSEALAQDEAACGAAAQALVDAARPLGLLLDGEGPQAVEALAARCAQRLEQARAAAQNERALRSRLEEAEAAVRRAREEHEVEDAALQALLARGKAQDAEAFRTRAAQAKARAELEQRLRAEVGAIEAAARASVDEAARQVADAGGADALAEHAHAKAQEVAGLEERQKVLEQQRGQVRQELSTLESDGKVAQLRLEEERLVHQAQTVARRYARERLGLILLSRARRKYEEEQQPEVVQLASAYFTQLTGARYVRVFVPAEDAAQLRVVDAAGEEKGPEQLSRGTREQLYLAFRLAVVEHFGASRGALPVVLDDILVNFDPDRAHSAVKALGRLSDKHQVIAFTCHPWVRELFAAQGANVVSLSGARTVPLAAVNRA